ncbi:MAG: arsenate reductase family protein [Porphyromonadaceae bacterium]|jgi:arsenate reductase|nr:arsenate reductase family protein [Porphyromonadaceae bacterium]
MNKSKKSALANGDITILCYPKCGTCRKAEKWLKDNGIDYTYRPIKEANPSYDELKIWYEKSGLTINKFFNTSGLLYRSNNMKEKVKTLSENELLNILASDGLMVKRPILLKDDIVLIGFKEEEWRENLIS